MGIVVWKIGKDLAIGGDYSRSYAYNYNHNYDALVATTITITSSIY